MLLVVGGMIGLGKSSVAKILGEHFNSEVFYESVDDNPLLPLFYISYLFFRISIYLTALNAAIFPSPADFIY